MKCSISQTGESRGRVDYLLSFDKPFDGVEFDNFLRNSFHTGGRGHELYGQYPDYFFDRSQRGPDLSVYPLTPGKVIVRLSRLSSGKKSPICNVFEEIVKGS